MNEILNREARFAFRVLVLLIIAAGCTRTPYFKVMNCSVESSVPAGTSLPVSYLASVSLDFPVVKGDTSHVVTSIRHAIVANALGWQFDTIDVAKASRVFVDSLASDFSVLAGEMAGAGLYEGSDDVETMEWTETRNGYFAGSRSHYSSYVIDYYNYSGGAGPDVFTTGLVFDLITGAQMTLDDIFLPEFDDILGSLIRLHAGECLPEGEVQSDLVHDIMPTGNFVITGNSITFIYNPYEITENWQDVIHISVPLRECRKAGILAVKL